MTSRHFFFLVMLVMTGWMITAEAWAHRDRGPDDPCRKQIGASLLHLTLYQPQFDPIAEYCEEIPRAGKAVLVVDVTAGELRQTPMSLEVIETESSGQARTVLSTAPKTYEDGVLDTDVTFNEGSSYLARVVLELGTNRELQVLSFPIQVSAWYKAMLIPALIVAALLALTAVSVVRYYVVSRQDESLAA
jgi:hypothetical protein